MELTFDLIDPAGQVIQLITPVPGRPFFYPRRKKWFAQKKMVSDSRRKKWCWHKMTHSGSHFGGKSWGMSLSDHEMVMESSFEIVFHVAR